MSIIQPRPDSCHQGRYVSFVDGDFGGVSVQSLQDASSLISSGARNILAIASDVSGLVAR